ncbi:hypothetical protein [Micromonospora arida]|uniref:hypothetical protein n=1 Tax=Micromonospora arida TaxID=2203715 RepID=UPI0033BC7EE5
MQQRPRGAQESVLELAGFDHGDQLVGEVVRVAHPKVHSLQAQLTADGSHCAGGVTGHSWFFACGEQDE